MSESSPGVHYKYVVHHALKIVKMVKIIDFVH
jgi:hypothetical protein